MQNVSKALSFLRENPYFVLSDYEIDKVIDLIMKVENCLKTNIPIVSYNEKISLNEAERLLVNGKIDYPTLNVKSKIPTIYDVAARINTWSFSIDDEEDQVKALINYYYENNVKIEFSESKTEFLKKVIADNKKKYLQFYIDLCMPEEEDGRKLMRKVKEHTQKDKITPLLYFYTHYGDTAEPETKELNVPIVEKVTKHQIKPRISPLISELYLKLNNEFNLFPNTPIIDKLINIIAA